MSLYHITCSGLKARDADALADPQKFLQWTCPDCRKVNIEFYKLFKDSKVKFNAINNDLMELQKKFTEFGELFGKYRNLDKFVSNQHTASPKRKRDGLRSASTHNVSPLLPPAADPNEEVVLTSSGELNPSYPLDNNPTSPSTKSMSPLPRAADISSITNNFNNLQPTSSYSKAVANVADINNILVTSPKPLRVIPPSRSIFISRLASDTAIKDIEFYIRSKIGDGCNLSIHKFVYSQPRTISSFKITVSDEYFEKIKDFNFWPANTYVREYVPSERQKNTVRLPTPQIPKN